MNIDKEVMEEASTLRKQFVSKANYLLSDEDDELFEEVVAQALQKKVDEIKKLKGKVRFGIDALKADNDKGVIFNQEKDVRPYEEITVETKKDAIDRIESHFLTLLSAKDAKISELEAKLKEIEAKDNDLLDAARHRIVELVKKCEEKEREGK